MTKAKFLDNTSIEVVVQDGEKFLLETHLPVSNEDQHSYLQLIEKYFEQNFEDDKTSMVYWVLMKMDSNHGLSFKLKGSDRSEERKRIGNQIKTLRKTKGIEAKKLAKVIKIDPANLSRIEKGKYSVGLDILTKIANILDAKVELVPI
jgi:DNA-binding XRE family transcriptional regulator